MRNKHLAIFVVVLAFLCMTPDAFAGTSGASTIANTFLSATTSWYSSLKTIAEEIFYALFGIDFVYLVAQWLIGGKDVHEIFSSFIKKLLTIGAFFTILINGHQLISWVINGFKQSGVAAAGQPHTGLGWIIGTGANILVTCVEGPIKSGSGGAVQFLWDTITSGGNTAVSTIIGALVGLVVGIIAILALIYLALEYLAIQLEAALVASIGIIMLGFAGSRWTVQHAEGYLKYALSVGVRLMVLVIWVAFIENNSTNIINNLLAGVKQSGGTNIPTTLDAYANILIFVLLIAWLAKKLPSIAASVMTGSSSLSGGELTTGIAAGAVLAGAAVATGGAALAGAGAAGGALTAVEAAALDASTAGSLGSAGGMGATGGAGSLSAAGEIASTTPGEARLLGESGGWRQSFDMGGGDAGGPVPQPDMESLMKIYRESMKNASKDSASDSSERPKTVMEKYEELATQHETLEQLLSPGKASTDGVQAASMGLKHSE